MEAKLDSKGEARKQGLGRRKQDRMRSEERQGEVLLLYEAGGRNGGDYWNEVHAKQGKRVEAIGNTGRRSKGVRGEGPGVCGARV
jgi:hypothetical protein